MHAEVVVCHQVGNEAWQSQHNAVVALNAQAHQNVAAHSDEFVKEALVQHDRINMLVFDLLLIEVARTLVCQRLGASQRDAALL